MCRILPPIANGSINYTSDEMPRPIGTVAIYSCDDGFFLNGSEKRTCFLQALSGLWDESAPTCDPESECSYNKARLAIP